MAELDKPFYTPKEVAELLDVHPSTVLNYVHTGDLYAIRLSRRMIRIPNAALRRFLDAGGGAYPVIREPAEVDPTEADREEAE